MLTRAEQMENRTLTDEECADIHAQWSHEDNKEPLIQDSPIGKQIFAYLIKKQKNRVVNDTAPQMFVQGGTVKGQAY